MVLLKDFSWITSIPSYVIAICAMIALYYNRRHYFKIVKPLIIVGYGDFENYLLVELRNCGVGPAKIINTRVFKDDDDEIKNTLIDWLPKKLDKSCEYKYYASRYKDYYLSSNNSYKLIEIKIDDEVQTGIEQREIIRAILKDLYIIVDFEDIYGKRFESVKMNLKYFGRTDHVNN
ncbi:hypothetical protein [Echinicola shivajiensis]|uniref:hypothetical protein n=1 Tax=Echinicola shivajiensis TaxID=1035916 RepID=UPI001BFCCE8C|nr:hypothetical protein [Echinicola shivajiensis]